MFRSVLIVTTAIMGISTAALANPGTKEEQDACRPDVRRLCQTAGTDQFVVLACLQQHRVKLSKACRKVLEDHGV